MEYGEGSYCKEDIPSGDSYDELHASQMSNTMNWMSNCRSHRYMTDGESTVWTSMTKPFIIDGIVLVTNV
jgi:hypothetical protein